MDIRKDRKRNTIYMKGLKFALRGVKVSLRTLILPLSVMALAVQTQAQVINLVNNNSSAQVSVNSQSGMFNWFVDGQNQLNQQWFWYRTGTNAEQSIETISPAIFSQPNAQSLNSAYFNGAYGVTVRYTLTGFSPGSGEAHLQEIITITNATAQPLDFHFFQYSDFDLGGTAAGDTVQLGTDSFGKFNEADQSEGTSLFSEIDLTPGANHGQADLFPNILLALNDPFATTLNDNAGPVGPGDATSAFEWDFLIPGNSSVGISKNKVLLVPEPTSVSLLGLGLVALFASRRRVSGK